MVCERRSDFGGVFDRQMKIAMRLLDAVHFRCLNARGTLFTVQKALRLFNVFVDFTNRFVWYRCRWVRAWGKNGRDPTATSHGKRCNRGEA